MMSTFYFFTIKGNKFALAPFSRKTLENKNIISNYRSWFHDQRVTKYNSHGLFPYTEKQFNEYMDELDHPTDKLVMGIFHVDTNRHIGNVSLQSIDWINRSAELAIIIGETEYHNSGVGKYACQLMLEHGFLKMNLHRIWTGTTATNIPMVNLALSCGFSHEGTFRQAAFLEGKYISIQEFGLLVHEYITILEKENATKSK
jgi:[ribosomal protein S5]-alanine N-acetyltransferase